MIVDTVFSLAPGVEVIRKDSETVLLKAPHAAVELKGGSADLFELEIAPRLLRKAAVSEIAQQVSLADEEPLSSLLADLNQAGLVLKSDPEDASEATFSYFEMAGLDVANIRSQFSSLRILIFGQGALGVEMAKLLAQLKPLKLTLCDPYTTAPGDTENESRFVHELRRRFPDLNVSASTVDALDEQTVFEMCSDSNLVISAYGDRYTAVEHWINRSIHELSIPGLFCGISSGKSYLGPLVFPTETACYTCWKMRSIACQDNFGEAMAFEEQRASHRSPRTLAPSEPLHLASIVAGTAFNELVKCLVAVGKPKLTDAVLLYEPFKTGWTENHFLRRPDCPVCGKKKEQLPPCPVLEDLERKKEADVLEFFDHLVNSEVGIIRRIERVHKDISEPRYPLIYRAEISNHRFLNKEEQSFITASGKGFTHEGALRSSMGEALERYSASAWGEDVVLRSTARQLESDYLNPARLVLFSPSQYDELKYDPYRPDQEIGWVRARSLGFGGTIAVPALSVLMAYETEGSEPFMFPITSNGLAAGPSLYQAILSAAYEVIERDAFLYAWLNKIPCERVDPALHPDVNVKSLVKSHARRGVELELYSVPVDHGVSVFIGIAFSQRGDEPAAVVGLGANHDPAVAAASALVEACQVRPALRVRLRRPDTQRRLQELIQCPQDVQSLEDHDLLYSHHSMLGSFDFLRAGPVGSYDWSRSVRPDSPLETLTARLKELDTDILYVDLTTSEIAATGVRVVRVVIPDFQPMHFGFRERRLAAKRLYEMPVRLGLRARPSSAEELNPLPHPLA